MDPENIILESQDQKPTPTIPEVDQPPAQQDKPPFQEDSLSNLPEQQPNSSEQQEELSVPAQPDQQYFSSEQQPTQPEQQPIQPEQDQIPSVYHPTPSTSSPSFDPNHISPSRSALSDQLSTPSKSSSSRSKLPPIDALSVGLLSEFKCLKDLETQLEKIVNHQQGLIDNVTALNGFYTHNEELMEAQLMMKKMNLYRMKLKKIKSDMLYIRSTTQSLLQKSIEIQNIKVNQKAEQVRRFDYEIGLIAKSKQSS